MEVGVIIAATTTTTVTNITVNLICERGERPGRQSTQNNEIP